MRVTKHLHKGEVHYVPPPCDRYTTRNSFTFIFPFFAAPQRFFLRLRDLSLEVLARHDFIAGAFLQRLARSSTAPDGGSPVFFKALRVFFDGALAGRPAS